MVVVPFAPSGVFPSVLPVEGDRGRIGFGNLQKNSPLRLLTERGQQSRRHAAPPEVGIDGDIEELGLVGSALTPGTESSRPAVDYTQQQGVSGVIAERPLGRLGAAVLDTGDGRVVAFQCGPDQNGVGACQLREPGASERPASGWTTELPQMATPVRINACRKLFSMA